MSLSAAMHLFFIKQPKGRLPKQTPDLELCRDTHFINAKKILRVTNFFHLWWHDLEFLSSCCDESSSLVMVKQDLRLFIPSLPRLFLPTPFAK